ncbi:hypothetical protein M5K25_007676 [Dendrobium thyrsiflorum]|uniref:Uncharacterized protein n=1 Tax=Dendrobium thyrsiflorum TaxID=117978 RepID=A0ABD0VF19_DENTH
MKEENSCCLRFFHENVREKHLILLLLPVFLEEIGKKRTFECFWLAGLVVLKLNLLSYLVLILIYPLLLGGGGGDVQNSPNSRWFSSQLLSSLPVVLQQKPWDDSSGEGITIAALNRVVLG